MCKWRPPILSPQVTALGISFFFFFVKEQCCSDALTLIAAYRVSVHRACKWSPEDISNVTVILHGLSTNHTACPQAPSCNFFCYTHVTFCRRGCLHKRQLIRRKERWGGEKSLKWRHMEAFSTSRALDDVSIQSTPRGWRGGRGRGCWCDLMCFFSVIALIFHTAPLTNTRHKLCFNGPVPLRWDEWCSTLTSAGLNGGADGGGAGALPSLTVRIKRTVLQREMWLNLSTVKENGCTNVPKYVSIHLFFMCTFNLHIKKKPRVKLLERF